MVKIKIHKKMKKVKRK